MSVRSNNLISSKPRSLPESTETDALCPIAASALDIEVSQRAMTTAHVRQAGRNSMSGYGREVPVHQPTPPDPKPSFDFPHSRRSTLKLSRSEAKANLHAWIATTTTAQDSSAT